MSGYKRNLISHGQRGCCFFLEHAHVKQENNTVVSEHVENGTFKTFNIPHINCNMVLLGEGTSITSCAARQLAASDTLLIFAGFGGGSFSSGIPVDFLPLEPQSEYRPTEYMQIWSKKWHNDDLRLSTAKLLMLERVKKTKELWSDLDLYGISGTNVKSVEFKTALDSAKTLTDVMSCEGVYTKKLYDICSKSILQKKFIKGTGDTDDTYLKISNYLMYGCASVALHAMGISFALSTVHGKTRRGGLVFDIADLIKDGIMPIAFKCAVEGKTEDELKNEITDLIFEKEIISYMCEQIKKILCEK